MQLGSFEDTLATQNHLDSCTMGTGSFPGVKLPGLGVDTPPPSSVEFNEMRYTCKPVPLGLLQGATFFTQNHFACREVPSQLLPQPGVTIKLHPHYIYGPPFCRLICSHSVPA